MHFPDLPLMLAVYNVLDPTAVPKVMQSDAYMNYGSEELQKICDHFCVARGNQTVLIDAQALRDGWPRIKSYLHSSKEKRIWEDVQEEVEPKKDKVADPFSEGAYRHSATGKRRIFTTTKKHRPMSVLDICTEIITRHAESPIAVDQAWVTLCRIYVVWILATADCERGFSLLKSIKTALRNRLVVFVVWQVCGMCVFCVFRAMMC